MRSQVLAFSLLFSAGLPGIITAQSLSEYGAAAAGGATGSAAGKKVSEGITAIFGKVDKQAASAAKGDDAQKQQTAPAAVAPAPASAPASTLAPSMAGGTVGGSGASGGGGVKSTASTSAKKTPAASKVASKGVAKKSDKDDPYNLVPPPPPIQRVSIGRPADQSPQISTRLAALASPAAPQPVPVRVAPPPVSADDLRRITPGADRDAVLKLGPFASRITMIENGHLAETYRYPAGVVRVSDGVVATVDVQ